MKKLALKGMLFCTIIIGMITMVLLLSAKEPLRSLLASWTKSTEYMEQNEMIPIFDQGVKQDGTRQLVIGDSICRQMFSGLGKYNKQTSFLGTNAALMISGQYLLAKEYIEAHPEATDVFLIMHPLTIIRTFDTEWSYRYAVMTYVETNTIEHLDQNTIDIMADVYGTFFMQEGIVQLIEDSPICRKLYLSHMSLNGSDYVQSSSFEIADQYVKKLYDLCQENQVELHFYSSPVAEYYREEMEELAIEYEGTWMSTKYPDYMKDIWFYPSEWSEDLSHFSGEYAERKRLNETIEQAYGQTELLKKIKLRLQSVVGQ
ncbi:hypothetical protein LJC58_08380 [Lachnospiraceae bacterium OttesenSCG-928-D06]|nr:hypothetical protein [Lachnospiraceae bacterium OttesenSCG-928-D06]